MGAVGSQGRNIRVKIYRRVSGTLVVYNRTSSACQNQQKWSQELKKEIWGTGTPGILVLGNRPLIYHLSKHSGICWGCY